MRVKEKFVVVRDTTKKAKICRGRIGGGYRVAYVCEVDASPSPEQLVEILNGWSPES